MGGATQGGAEGVVDKQTLQGGLEFDGVGHQQPGRPVVDRVAEAAGAGVTDGGHAMLGGFHHRQPPPLFAGGHEVDGGAGEERMLIVLGHLTVQGDARIGTDIVAEFILPPAGTDDIEHHVVGQTPHRIDCVFDLFVGDQAR